MTVKDLIACLKKLPQDYEVWYDGGDADAVPAGPAYIGFITDTGPGGSWTIWHDEDDFDEVEVNEDERKEKVVVIG